jgi:hypothetical protein
VFLLTRAACQWIGPEFLPALAAFQSRAEPVQAGVAAVPVALCRVDAAAAAEAVVVPEAVGVRLAAAALAEFAGVAAAEAVAPVAVVVRPAAAAVLSAAAVPAEFAGVAAAEAVAVPEAVGVRPAGAAAGPAAGPVVLAAPLFRVDRCRYPDPCLDLALFPRFPVDPYPSDRLVRKNLLRRAIRECMCPLFVSLGCVSMASPSIMQRAFGWPSVGLAAISSGQILLTLWANSPNLIWSR